MNHRSCLLRHSHAGNSRDKSSRPVSSLLVLIALTVMLCACTDTDKRSADILRIEKLISTHPDSALRAIDRLPAGQYAFRAAGSIHTPHCLSRLYFYKAAHILAHGTPDSALCWIRQARAAAMDGHHVPEESVYLSAQASAQSHQDLLRADSVWLWMGQLSVYADLTAVPMADTAMFRHRSDSIRSLALACLGRASSGIAPHNIGGGGSVTGRPLPVPGLYGLMTVLALVLAFLLFYKRREESVARDGRQMAIQQETIDNLNETIRRSEQANSNLHEQIALDRQMSYDHIGRGKVIFERLMSGGRLKNISIADEQCLIDYYAFAHAEVYRRMVASYYSLSLRHTTYLMLCQLGFTSQQIEHILFVQPSTLRNYRLRIKRNLKNT